MKRYTSRPSPIMSTIAVVVGIFMLIFGVVFLSSARDTKTPGPVIAFMAVWFIALIGIIIYHATNAFGKKGMPTNIIEAEDAGENESPRKRLEQLEGLRRDNLINDAEYQAKRAEIVKEL